MRFAGVLLCVGSLLLLPACGGGEPGSPEEQIRGTLDAIEEAVEVGDLDALRDGVSDHYSDERGHDKQALVRYLTLRILGNPQRHVISRIRGIEIDGSFATVRLHAGLASTPLPDPNDWSGLRASVYAMDLQFALEDGDVWRLMTAVWRRATPAEFL